MMSLSLIIIERDVKIQNVRMCAGGFLKVLHGNEPGHAIVYAMPPVVVAAT